MKLPKLPSYWKGFLTAAAIVSVWTFILSPQWGANIESASWMPEGASKGAYAHGGSILILGPPVYYREYDISEQDMVNYLKEKGWDYHEIEEPRMQERYLAQFCSDADLAHEHELYSVYVTVENGIYHDSYKLDSGRRILYDREKGRAYYRFDSR